MRYLIILLLLGVHLHANAARQQGCTTSWRVGHNIVKVGDDVGRALKSIERARHHVDWLRGPNSSKWTLVKSGYNRKTIQIKIKDGQLQQICQFQ
ncbi:MAG: hypothetical protein ACSHXK_02250 [Oceanococcus sp.]